MAMCSGAAGAQQQLSNFDACVSDGTQRHTDATMENYLSYKCDGIIAQKLAARPDQCADDVRPPLRNIERKSRQLTDGLYLRMIWRTHVCAGMCETRIYSDGRDTNYLCEVRRHIEGRVVQDGPSPRDTGYRRSADEYQSGRGTYRPVTGYDQPRDYTYGTYRRRVPETDEDLRRGRRISGGPDWYLVYEYPPAGYPDDDRRDDYRRDDYRRD
jgi:hypothetical protein